MFCNVYMNSTNKRGKAAKEKIMSGSFGSNVWWTVPALVVDGKLAQAVLVANGFDKSAIPLPTRREVVRRAADSFANRRVRDDKKITEKARENADEVSYGILDFNQDDSERVSYRQHTLVKLDKASGRVSAEGDLADKVLEAVAAYEGKINDSDVRAFLLKVVAQCYGVAKRPSGGIYFIPEKYVEKVQAVRNVLRELGTGAKIYVEGVINGVQERQNVWESVEDEINQRIEETLAAVGKIGKRVNAAKDKESELEGLKELMEAYKGLLGEEAKYEGVADKIENAVKQVAEKISQLRQAA